LSKHLHIVCFDIPYPPDYGGVAEVFFKIKSLAEAGIKIHLHCFKYGRTEQPELKKYCFEVCYYQRNQGHKGISFNLPYIVSSRANEKLLENLLKDDYPILMEGIQSTYFIDNHKLENRKIVVRLHNVEFEYYKQLAKQTKSIIKKTYYLIESLLLKNYERKIANKALFLGLTEKDVATYKSELKASSIFYLPPFIGWKFPLCLEGIGSFCLYHGNLSVAENERAAFWLLENVFNDIEIPFVIAGKNPSDELINAAHKKTHTCLVANPSEKEMHDLIQKAQINVLPSFSTSGIKFKYLYSIFCGRHCIINDNMQSGTFLGSATHIGNNADAFKSIIFQLFNKPFGIEEIELREQLMHEYYNNKNTAEQLINFLY
jgi:glycosyltransferase involved in cell wall biosynthesis